MAVKKLGKKDKQESLFGDNAKVSNQKAKRIQISWMWWALVVFVVGFILFYVVFSKIGTFEYKGLAFDKQAYGDELTLYHHSYFYTYNKQTYKNNVYLRIDPRENEVPVSDEILFIKGRTAYLSINNTNITNCRESQIAIAAITQFFVNNQFDLKLGTPDLNVSKERKQPYIDCQKADDNTVIIVQNSDKTNIIKKGDSCYFININQCEIQPAVEKFIVNSLVDTREYRESLKA